jgi:hypothetical protein
LELRDAGAGDGEFDEGNGGVNAVVVVEPPSSALVITLVARLAPSRQPFGSGPGA